MLSLKIIWFPPSKEIHFKNSALSIKIRKKNEITFLMEPCQLHYLKCAHLRAPRAKFCLCLVSTVPIELSGRSVHTHIDTHTHSSYNTEHYSLPKVAILCQCTVYSVNWVSSIKKCKQSFIFPFLNVLERMIIKIRKKNESLWGRELTLRTWARYLCVLCM